MAEESEDQDETKSPKKDEFSQDEGSTVDGDAEETEEDDDEDSEEDEPKLKYARLTSNLGSVYRNGDATSTFLVAGDKMVGF